MDRAKFREMLLENARKPTEPDITCYGIKVSEMTREELEAMIYRQARSLQHYESIYTPGLEL